MNTFGISEKAFVQIVDTLKSFDFISKAVIFGSRAKGTYRRYSDVDICIFGELDIFDSEKVKGALDDLNAIYEFDVVSWDAITTPSLREHINRVGIPFMEK